MIPWWKRHQERYQLELRELDRAGIQWERDEDAFQRGILRLNLQVNHAGEQLVLQVIFPDLFPYFRFEVLAPSLALPHHQNPFEKNLCLMPRATHHWNTTDTVAGILQQQLPKTISVGQSEDVEGTRGIEEDQAEPYSEYYPCAPSMVVIPSDVPIPEGQNHGSLTVRTNGPPGPELRNFLRGAVVSMRDSKGSGIVSSFIASSAFRGKTYDGFWAKLATPIAYANAGEFLKELLQRVPDARNAPINQVAGGHFQFWGVTFPEETSRRALDGLGWIFVCLFGRSRDGMVGGRITSSGGKSNNSKKGRGKGRGQTR